MTHTHLQRMTQQNPFSKTQIKPEIYKKKPEPTTSAVTDENIALRHECWVVAVLKKKITCEVCCIHM